MKLDHVLSAKQFLDRDKLDELFRSAGEMEKNVTEGKRNMDCAGKILAAVFYEPSTRTRFSFETAMYRLGGDVISSESAGQFSSAIKGETIEDSMQVVSGYADVIVLRHPKEGAAEIAAKTSRVPVVNAGDGAGEHPTQALLDYYTMQKEQGRLDGLHIAFVGDLRFGRTVHSLLYLLPILKDVRVSLIAPANLRLPDMHLEYLKAHGIIFEEAEDFRSVVAKADIFYITRVQKERFADVSEYEAVKDAYIINKSVTEKMRAKASIMHPLPRVNEIAPEVDADVRAAYFRQTRNGVFVRMAILKNLLCP